MLPDLELHQAVALLSYPGFGEAAERAT